MSLLFIFSSRVHAITINGSNEITTNGSASYTASGCSGTVTWGATNSGASVNQSTLTTSGACGNVLVAARCSADGEIATKNVRVTDGGQWVATETIYNPSECKMWNDRGQRWQRVLMGQIFTCTYISGKTRTLYGYSTYGWNYENPPEEYPVCVIGGVPCDADAFFRRYEYKSEWQCSSSSACPSYNITPQAQETCGDLIDNNCNGEVDEECVAGGGGSGGEGDGDEGSGDGGSGDGNGGGGGNDCSSQAEICGDNLDNDCDGNVDEGCEVCEVGVRILPSEVAPQKTSGNTKADIEISLQRPVPSDGCVIDLKVYPVPYSGGHDHHDALRPYGKLDGSDKLTIYFTAGETDPTSVKYTSGEVAGTEEITATVRETGEKITNTIDVKVPILGILGSSSEWRLTGSYGEPGVKSMHIGNHYGEAYTIGAMMTIASDYLEETKTTLGINDMSLERGGLFDVNNNWSAVPGHSLHRKGTSVDISRYVYNAKTKKTSLINCLDDDDLRDIARENFGYLHCESGGRKHIEFSVCDLNVKGVKQLCGRK